MTRKERGIWLEAQIEDGPASTSRGAPRSSWARSWLGFSSGGDPEHRGKDGGRDHHVVGVVRNQPNADAG